MAFYGGVIKYLATAPSGESPATKCDNGISASWALSRAMCSTTCPIPAIVGWGALITLGALSRRCTVPWFSKPPCTKTRFDGRVLAAANFRSSSTKHHATNHKRNTLRIINTES